MLSVIIPSYKDPFLKQTIESVLQTATGEIEVIPVLDGYEPEELVDDPRVFYLRQENTGMRGAINAGVKKSKGEYLMRTDEHCMFCPGFDEIVTKDIKDNEIVNITRYFLDPENWTVMDKPPVFYEKLVIDKTHNKFHGVPWRAKERQNQNIMIDEDMAMQGSCWFMKRSWWDKVIGELSSEGYGTLYQDSIEMVFKTWKAGGRLTLNKNAWYAHKHRDFNRSHSYPNQLARESWDYAIEVWGDYYFDIIYPRFFGVPYAKN